MPPEPSVLKPPTDEPVFNTFRRKPLRPFYSLREVQLGALTLLIMGAVVAWVVWRGAHPEPGLFTLDDRLLTARGKEIPVYERPVQPWVEPGSQAAGAGAGSPRLDPFPAAVISEGWRVTAAPQMFDESNLYSKIDGRETFYKSYGFKKLYFLSLVSTAQKELTLDIELFDLSSVANTLGALIAEISNPDTTPVTLDGQAMSYTTQNGGFLAKGRYYARMVGSDADPSITTKVTALRAALVAALPGESLPWAYEFFVGKMGFSPARIQYFAENAFSFGFANEFYASAVPGSEAEVFLSRRTNETEAREIADKMVKGFGEQGKAVAGDGPLIFKNSYIESFDGVAAQGVYVMGVRLAPSVAEAQKWMQELGATLKPQPDSGH